MSLVFLLGSGISLDADMPGVRAITAQVVSGEGIYLDTTELFRLGPHDSGYGLYRDRAKPVLALLEDLRWRAARYYRRDPQYEELSQFARQVDDALAGEYEAPAVMRLIEELKERPYACGDLERIREISGQVHRYIADTVAHMLSRSPTGVDHLSAIVGACAADDRVTLATLNHDLVLEAALEGAEIEYADGFERTDEDVRLWANDWGHGGVRLLKLHGSLNWWDYRVTDQLWRDWVTACFQGEDPWRPQRAGIEWDPREYRPVILTGTFDKILAYESSVFPDQHLRFHEALRATNRVVVVGYGFGDKAINSRIISWLARERANKLIVCHAAPERLAARSRGAVRSKWTRWARDGQLALIRSYVGDLDYQTLASRLR